jgi:hypothetical protein
MIHWEICFEGEVYAHWYSFETDPARAIEAWREHVEGLGYGTPKGVTARYHIKSAPPRPIKKGVTQ